MYSSNETIHFPLTGFQTGKILVSLLPEGPVGRDSCAGPHQDHRLVGVLGHMEIRGSKEYKWRTCVAVSNEPGPQAYRGPWAYGNTGI